MMPDALLLLLIGLPFAGSLAAAFLPLHARDAAALLAGIIALAGLALVWAAYPTIAAGGIARHETEWMPSLGLNFVLRMDGFAWLFAGLVTSAWSGPHLLYQLAGVSGRHGGLCDGALLGT